MPMPVQQHMAIASQAQQHAQAHASMRLRVARLETWFGEKDTMEALKFVCGRTTAVPKG
jgi:hypothetical protein